MARFSQEVRSDYFGAGERSLQNSFASVTVVCFCLLYLGPHRRTRIFKMFTYLFLFDSPILGPTVKYLFKLVAIKLTDDSIRTHAASDQICAVQTRIGAYMSSHACSGFDTSGTEQALARSLTMFGTAGYPNGHPRYTFHHFQIPI